MEIIEGLEPSRRHVWRGGAVCGLLREPGFLHCYSIAAGAGRQRLRAGRAGIVADSVPELEHEESLNKAQAVIRAIERAREL